MARRLLLGLVLGLVALVLLIGGMLALAQTAPGQRFIVAQIERALSTPEAPAEVRGLSGTFPFDVRLERVALADEAGVWLEVEDAVLTWAPRGLLRGRLQVEELAARRVAVHRAPVDEEEVARDEPLRLPELPGTLPPLTVERLAIDSLELGEDLLGEPVVLALDGRLVAVEERLGTRLELTTRRVDHPTAEGSIEAVLELDPPALDLHARIHERGGLLAAVTEIVGAGDLSLDVRGSGPLDNWRGRAVLVAEGVAEADLDLVLAATGIPRLALAGELRPAPGLLPPDLAPIVGEGVSLSTSLRQTGAQQLQIERLAIVNEALDLQASGGLDLDRERLDDLDARLEIHDLATFSELVGEGLGGQLEVSLHAGGPFTGPQGAMQLSLRAPRVAEVAADGLEIELAFAADDPLAATPRLRVTGDGRIAGLAIADAPPLPERDFELVLAGTISEERLAIAQLELYGALIALTASGDLDPRDLSGAVNLTLEVPELARINAAYDLPLTGRLTLAAEAALAAEAERVELVLSGGLEDLGGLPEDILALLGPALDLQARAAFEPAREARLEALELRGATFTLGAEGAAALPDGALAGEVRLSLPDLMPASGLVGEPVSGALTARAALGGTLQAPTLDLRADGEDVVVAGQALDALALRLTADLAAAPEGLVQLALTAAGLDATLDARYRLDEQLLHLDDIQLGAPATQVTGALALDLDGTLASGRLDGRVLDLAAFRPLLPMRLAGEVDARLDLRHDGERQEVALEVEGRGLAAGQLGTARRVQLEGVVGDALGTPSLQGTLVAQGVRQDDLQLAQARIEANGPLAALRASAALQGRMVEPFTLDTEVVLALAEETIAAEVESLAGTVAGAPFRLLAPLELRLADEAFAVEGLALDLGGGRLEGRLRLADTVDLEASLQELPLRLLEAFGGPPLIGVADGSLRASGSATNPTAELDLWVRGARFDQPDYADLPPLELTATAALAERRLSAELRAGGLTAEPIVAELDLPLVVELQPFVFALPEDGEIGGRLEAALDLATVTEFVDLPDQSLSGAFRAQLSLGGTLAEPQVGGDVTLSNGRYDNGMTGTTLRNLTLRAEARQRALTIVELTATDGGRGRITGEGAVSIEPLRDFPFNLGLRISGAELVRREDVRAVLGGEIALAGDTTAAALSGRIRVNEATMSVPEAPGAGLPVIDVEEIGAGANTVVEEPVAVTPPFALDLDLLVEVPGQVFVRGLGLDSEWQGQLEIQGSADEPVVVGSLEIRRGHFDFLDKRFDLRRGVIEFTGAVPPEPVIDVEASARGRNITGVIRLTGPVDAPVLSLESEPPLPEDEILAQLLFDQSVSDMSPGQAASLAIAINRLRGGPVGFDPLGQVRDRLGLDRLEVTGELGDPGIAAGRYLTDDIFVGVETGTAEAAGRAEVEIDILPGLSLQADVTEEGRSGVGIRWRFDY